MRVYLANKRIAWQIPPGHIADRYYTRCYLPPQGWTVERKLPDGVEVIKPLRRNHDPGGTQAELKEYSDAH